MNNRKMYNTTLDAELIRRIKILAAQQEKRQNDLLEEAIEDLLRKYETEAEVWIVEGGILNRNSLVIWA